MAERARGDARSASPGVELETPAGPLATLVTFTVGDLEPEAINLALEERGVLARWLPKPRSCECRSGSGRTSATSNGWRVRSRTIAEGHS